MANLKSKIQTTGKLKGKSRSQKEIVAQSVGIGQFNVSIGDLNNVDVAGQRSNVEFQTNQVHS